MLAWWWLIIALIVGSCIGAVVMGVCAYDNVRSGKRWWEDND